MRMTPFLLSSCMKDVWGGTFPVYQIDIPIYYLDRPPPLMTASISTRKTTNYLNYLNSMDTRTSRSPPSCSMVLGGGHPSCFMELSNCKMTFPNRQTSTKSFGHHRYLFILLKSLNSHIQFGRFQAVLAVSSGFRRFGRFQAVRAVGQVVTFSTFWTFFMSVPI